MSEPNKEEEEIVENENPENQEMVEVSRIQIHVYIYNLV